MEIISRIVGSAREDLASSSSREELRRLLLNLESEYSRQVGGEQEKNGASSTLLHSQLLVEAFHLGNVELCRLLASNLHLQDLSAVLDTCTESSERALRFVANYLQLDVEEIFENQSNESINSLSITTAGKNKPDMLEKKLSSRLTQFELAFECELEENFGEALSLYESSGTQSNHFPRVSMKHLMSSANDILHEYCSKDPNLHNIWLKYLISNRRYKEASDLCESLSDEFSLLFTLFHEPHTVNKLNQSLPVQLHKFADSGESKWTDEGQLDLMKSIGMSRNLDEKRLLSHLIAFHLIHNNVPVALSLAFSLDQASSLLDRYLNMTNHPVNLESVSKQSANYFASAQLICSTINTLQYDLDPNVEVIYSTCLELGLLDELLQLVSEGLLCEASVSQISKSLERLIESASHKRLDLLDPTMERSTMIALIRLFKRDDAKELSGNVLTTVIFALNIYLMKLDMQNEYSANSDISNLDLMFEYLSKYLKKVGGFLSASDGLVRATNGLVITIKNRLDFLGNSEAIRGSFKELVETVAERCLIESRYKSAALLYSQIEDSVNAVKALMRTGDADTVMNYALLVRDITVNRITTNYIKHLKLDPKVIEDFIARSKD